MCSGDYSPHRQAWRDCMVFCSGYLIGAMFGLGFPHKRCLLCVSRMTRKKKEADKMKIDFEYGHGLMTAELPDSTDIFIPGETVKDPDHIPEDQLEAGYLESLANPIGMPTLTELAHKGSTVTIIVPDRVKGGEHATCHRKMSIRYILKELYAAGVEKKDILFIISNGLHPRSKEEDARALFGEEIFMEFWPTGQIISHDSEDQEHMVDLGCTHRGDPVYMNKYVFDSN